MQLVTPEWFFVGGRSPPIGPVLFKGVQFWNLASYENAAVPKLGLDDLSMFTPFTRHHCATNPGICDSVPPWCFFSAWGLAPSAKSAIRLGFPSSSGAVSRQVAQGAGRMWFVQGGAPFRSRLIASPLVELSWWSVGVMVVRTCNNYIILYIYIVRWDYKPTFNLQLGGPALWDLPISQYQLWRARVTH